MPLFPRGAAWVRRSRSAIRRKRQGGSDSPINNEGLHMAHNAGRLRLPAYRPHATQIIVAEDDPDIRELVSTILMSAGYEIVACSDGRSALAAARAHSTAVLVVDVQMPNLNGLELCRELRADPVTATMRILLMSADSHADSAIVGVAAGANGFLPKPFTRKELLRRIDDLVGLAFSVAG
jgi:two-component system phosphate regulon response regulator PhoB